MLSPLNEPREVLGVGSDQHQTIHLRDRRNLIVHVRRGFAERLETCSFAAMPGGRDVVVGQDGERPAYDLLNIGFERHPSLAPR